MCVRVAAAPHLADPSAATLGSTAMQPVRSVVVFDAADLHSESAFWAGMLDGHVFDDAGFHSVIDAAGEWRIGVQLAPQHVPPDWPDGAPQQVHIHLHVEDPRQAHEQTIKLGPECFKPVTWEATRGTRCTPTPPATLSASVGGSRPGRRWLHSSVRGWAQGLGERSATAMLVSARTCLIARPVDPRHTAIDRLDLLDVRAGWWQIAEFWCRSSGAPQLWCWVSATPLYAVISWAGSSNISTARAGQGPVPAVGRTSPLRVCVPREAPVAPGFVRV